MTRDQKENEISKKVIIFINQPLERENLSQNDYDPKVKPLGEDNKDTESKYDIIGVDFKIRTIELDDKTIKLQVTHQQYKSEQN